MARAKGHYPWDEILDRLFNRDERAFVAAQESEFWQEYVADNYHSASEGQDAFFDTAREKLLEKMSAAGVTGEVNETSAGFLQTSFRAAGRFTSMIAAKAATFFR